MANHEWIRNLAKSRYEGGKWHTPKQPSFDLKTQALDQLLDVLQDAVTVFNQHASLPISLFPLSNAQGERLIGSLIVRGAIQIRLACDQKGEDIHLVGITVTTHDFQVKEQVFARLIATADAWGAIGWRQKSGTTWTTEMLVRNILIHLFEHQAR